MRDLSREKLLAELRALRPIFEQDGVTHMTLFGSRARRDNRPDSDVDLLIDVEVGRKFSLLDLVGVSHIIEDNLGMDASIVMRRSMSDEFADETKNDLVEVF